MPDCERLRNPVFWSGFYGRKRLFRAKSAILTGSIASCEQKVNRDCVKKISFCLDKKWRSSILKPSRRTGSRRWALAHGHRDKARIV